MTITLVIKLVNLRFNLLVNLFITRQKFSSRLVLGQNLKNRKNGRLCSTNRCESTSTGRVRADHRSPRLLAASRNGTRIHERMRSRFETNEGVLNAPFNQNQREHDPRFRDPERVLSFFLSRRRWVEQGSRGGQVKKKAAAAATS